MQTDTYKLVQLMQILFLAYYYLPHIGGGTWFPYYVSKKLSLKGHKVVLVVPNIDHVMCNDDESTYNFEKKNPSKTVRTPFFKVNRFIAPFLTVFFVFLCGMKLAKNSDIILCQFHPHHFMSVVAVVLGKIFGIPVVIRADDTSRRINISNRNLFQTIIISFQRIANLINLQFVKKSTQFNVISNEDKLFITPFLSKSDRKSPEIGIIPNGFEPTEKIFDKHRARRVLQLPLQSKILLFVGRYSDEIYGIDIVFQALPLMQNCVSEILLVLVGDRMKQKQAKLIESREVSDLVRVVGPVRNDLVPVFIEAADICIGPLMSTQTVPMKVLEYMALGKPTIAGIGSVYSEVALDGFNCVCVNADPIDFSNKVIKLINNEDYACFIGSNAQRVARQFTWDKIADLTEKRLLSALSSVTSR